MERILALSDETRRLMKKILWNILAIILIIGIAYLATGHNHLMPWNAKIWYWAGLIDYLIVYFVIISELDEYNVFTSLGRWMKGYEIIHTAIICILIIGFIVHFFYKFPESLQAIFGWSALVSAILLLIAAWIGMVTVSSAEEDY